MWFICLIIPKALFHKPTYLHLSTSPRDQHSEQDPVSCVSRDLQHVLRSIPASHSGESVWLSLDKVAAFSTPPAFHSLSCLREQTHTHTPHHHGKCSCHAWLRSRNPSHCVFHVATPDWKLSGSWCRQSTCASAVGNASLKAKQLVSAWNFTWKGSSKIIIVLSCALSFSIVVEALVLAMLKPCTITHNCKTPNIATCSHNWEILSMADDLKHL